MTKDQREHASELRKYAKELNDKSESGEWRHVVRGTPWNLRITKIKIRQQDHSQN